MKPDDQRNTNSTAPLTERATTWLEEQVYEPRRKRTVDLVRQSVDALRKAKQPISIATIVAKSKELDPTNRGVSASALLSNQEARTYYEQYRTWNITRSKRRLKPTRQSPIRPMSVKPDRDIGRVRQRYHRLSKSELVERLIVAEQDHAACQQRWLTTADEVLTWQQRAVAAEAQLKKLRDKEKHKT